MSAERKLPMTVEDPLQLPDDLPVPEDDGAADHLAGTALPPVALRATDDTSVRLDELEGRTVVFAYPRTGRPGEPSLGGDDEWDAIPETGEELFIAEEDYPEGAPPFDLPSQTAVFASGSDPEMLAEVSAKLRKAAGLHSKPTGTVANPDGKGNGVVEKVKDAVS